MFQQLKCAFCHLKTTQDIMKLTCLMLNAGNADFMQLQIATPDHQPGKQSSTVIVHANICMGSRLPFLSGSPHIPQPSKGFWPCKSTTQSQHASMPITSSSSSSSPSVCVSQNVYDERNKNLSEAQRRLKLDPDHLSASSKSNTCAPKNVNFLSSMG